MLCLLTISCLLVGVFSRAALPDDKCFRPFMLHSPCMMEIKPPEIRQFVTMEPLRMDTGIVDEVYRVLTHYRSCLNKNFPKDGCLATVVSVKHPLVNLITASCDTHKSDIVGVLNCFNEKPKVQAKFLTCGSTVASAFKEGHYTDKCKAVDDALSCLKEFDSCAPCHTERLLKAIEKSKEDRCNVVHFVDLQFTG